MLMTIMPDAKYIKISSHKVHSDNIIVKIVCQHFLSAKTKIELKFVYIIQNKKKRFINTHKKRPIYGGA